MEAQNRNVLNYYGGAKLVSGLDPVASGNNPGWARPISAKLGPRRFFLPILRSAGIGSAQHCSAVNSWGWLDTLHFIDFLPGATEGNRLVSDIHIFRNVDF